MIDLKNYSNENLLDRYKELEIDYSNLSKNLEKVLKDFTNIRSELILIELELTDRKLIEKNNATI
jgi:hypothetical protein